MNAIITTKLKILLSKILPNSEKIRYLTSLPKLHDFAKNRAKDCDFFESRAGLYDYLNNLLKNDSITYFEFGVYKGASINYWSSNNRNSQSLFYGFDTFTGLPESWNNFTGGLSKGVFDVDGQFPIIDDKRVVFFKGLFQDSLPDFIKTFNNNNQLIINIDADLYSSTLYVLTKLDSTIKTGTIIIFDEFSSMLHEFRALEDYCLSYRRNYKVIAATKSKNKYFAHVAVIIL